MPRRPTFVEVDRPTVEAPALTDDDPFWHPLRHLEVTGDPVRAILDVQDDPLGHPDVRRGVGHPGDPDRHRRRPDSRIQVHRRVPQRVHPVSQTLGVEQVAHLRQQLGSLVGQIVTLGEVVTQVIELPRFLWTVEGNRAETDPRHPSVKTRRHEPFVVDAAVAHHLEVLGTSALHPGISERRQHRLALDGHLVNPVHRGRWLDTRRVENGGGQIDDVVELIPNCAGVGDATGPRHGQPIACAAEMRCHLLHPLERRIQCPRPTDVVVAFTVLGPEVVDVFEQELRVLLETVLEGR